MPPRTSSKRKSSPLPKEIKIVAAVYTVSDDPAIFAQTEIMSARGALFGHTDHMRLRIGVRPGLAAYQSRDTLLHEALHGVLVLTDLTSDLTREQEEGFISRLTPVLLAMIRENPDLVRYLTSG